MFHLQLTDDITNYSNTLQYTLTQGLASRTAELDKIYFIQCLSLLKKNPALQTSLKHIQINASGHFLYIWTIM